MVLYAVISLRVPSPSIPTRAPKTDPPGRWSVARLAIHADHPRACAAAPALAVRSRPKRRPNAKFSCKDQERQQRRRRSRTSSLLRSLSRFASYPSRRADPPSGAAGKNWYRYTIRQGANAINGYLQGTAAGVKHAAEQIVGQLNERRAGRWGYRTTRAAAPAQTG